MNKIIEFIKAVFLTLFAILAAIFMYWPIVAIASIFFALLWWLLPIIGTIFISVFFFVLIVAILIQIFG